MRYDDMRDCEIVCSNVYAWRFKQRFNVLYSHVPHAVDSMYDNTLDGDTIKYE